jgi:prophage maintenance system killer protein
MIQLHPRMTLVTAAYFLRLNGYRLRWNAQRRALEIVPIH